MRALARTKFAQNVATVPRPLLEAHVQDRYNVADEEMAGAPDPTLTDVFRARIAVLVTLHSRGLGDVRAYPSAQRRRSD